jgi:hypothetical protein
MRAIQITPAFHFQNDRNPNWMAHTPVGHDNWGWQALAFAQPSGQFVQLLQGFVGDPNFPTFIPFVDNLDL